MQDMGKWITETAVDSQRYEELPSQWITEKKKKNPKDKEHVKKIDFENTFD